MEPDIGFRVTFCWIETYPLDEVRVAERRVFADGVTGDWAIGVRDGSDKSIRFHEELATPERIHKANQLCEDLSYCRRAGDMSILTQQAVRFLIRMP